MSAFRTLSAVAVAFFVLVGCSNPPAEPASPAPGAAQPSLASVEPKLVQIGESFEGPNATYTFTAIEVDPTCTEDYGPVPLPEAGHYIAVEMEVETKSYLNSQQVIARPTDLNFSVVDAEGFTIEASDSSDNAESCIANRGTFDLLAPSSKYRGWVGVLVPESTGELIFRFLPQNLLTGGQPGPGWKITYPATANDIGAEPAAGPAPEPDAEPVEPAEHKYPGYSCDLAVDGTKVCEGDVPESVGEHETPDSIPSFEECMRQAEQSETGYPSQECQDLYNDRVE